MGAPGKFPRPLVTGEHVLATDPPLARETGSDWRRRPRAFTGRSLTHHALEVGQVSQAGMQRLRGQAVSSGTLRGLGVTRMSAPGGPHPTRLVLEKGSGLTRSGEDIQISGGTVDLSAVRVMAPPESVDTDSGETEEEEEEEESDDRNLAGGGLTPPRPRVLGRSFGELPIEEGRPSLAILIAQPVTVEVPDSGDPACPPDRRDIGWLNPAQVDGARLVLYAWPDDVRAIGAGPDYRISPTVDQARSRIAQRIFALEALQARDAMHPWEEAGVPLALVAFADDGSIDWIDTAAVQRLAGQPRMRSHISGTREKPLLAEARLAQFDAHMSELYSQGIEAVWREMAALPPAGVLPGELVDVTGSNQALLPDGFDVTLTPALAEEVGRLIAESSCLAPISLERPGKIEFLLPVPSSEYDPDLLIAETLDPRFAQTRARLLSARSEALTIREDMRRRFDVLGLAAKGKRAIWPGDSSIESELAPDKFDQVPLDTVRGFSLSSKDQKAASVGISEGIELHNKEDASIFVWLSWKDPPGQVSVSLQTEKSSFAAYFGKESGPLGQPAQDGDNFLGHLPKEGGWTRLEFPLAAMFDKDGKPWPSSNIKKLALNIVGGQALLGAFGTVDGSGNFTYFSHGLLSSGKYAVDGDVDDFGPKLSREPRFGTAIRGELLQSSALADWLGRWQSSALAEARKLASAKGLEAVETDLDARLKRTNDSIDVGFVRARADIYRLRQNILGREEASRLVTSPALADLAVRDESARANADDLAKFLSRLMEADEADSKAMKPSGEGGAGGSAPPPPPPPPPSGGLMSIMPFVTMSTPILLASQPPKEAAKSSSLMVHSSSKSSSTKYSSSAKSYVAETATPYAAPSGGYTPLMYIPNTAWDGGAASSGSIPLGGSSAGSTKEVSAAPRVTVGPSATGTQAYGLNLAATRLGLFNPKISAADIVGQKALPGVVERTVTVAERIKQSDAAKTHEYALAGKLAVVNTVTRLMASGDGANPGITLADLPAPGFALRDAGSGDLENLAPATLKDMLEPPAGKEWIDIHDIEKLKADAEGDASSEHVHEIAYFSAAVAAIDDAIALMRLVEGRVDLFNKVLDDVRQTLARIRADGEKLEAALEAHEADLAEIRHDLSVAEALQAEEKARVEETNARRADVIARNSGTIVFRRPRLAPVVRAAASARVISTIQPDPVANCLADHEDQPEELREYCALFHDAPVGWFPEVSRELNALNKIAPAQKLLAFAAARATALPALAQARRAHLNRGLAGIHSILAARIAAAQRRRARTARLDLGVLSRFDLNGLHQTIQTSASMSDLLDGARERPKLARWAGEKLESISNIAACLHAAFGEVDPALRMQWAQLFSVHDERVPRLSELGVLPGWRTLTLTLRRELQDLTTWLFARIDKSNDEAFDAINDLVRITLLLAAHAPIDELIPATLIEPVPVRPGGLVPLRIPLDRVRLGQTGMIKDPRGAAVATIRAEAITPTHVEARIVRDFGLAREITSAMPIMLGGMGVRR